MSWRKEVESLAGVKCFWDADLTNRSTFRMISRGDLVEVESESALAALLSILGRNEISYRPLGWGANQVLKPLETDVLINLKFSWDESLLATPREEYELPASVGLNLLTSHALKFGNKGWEAMTGVPASLGGAIYMNAGTSQGEMASLVKRVRLMDRAGRVRELRTSAADFSYRKNHFVQSGEIIVGATLGHAGFDPALPEKIKTYLELRKQSQPLATKNCGCVFKNFTSTKQAGRLIDLTGLKGLSVGALRVSSRHANFMENGGGASAEDFQRLVLIINQQMRLHWGVEFELEVKAL
jgi:UDP-N-acetylmuramate dehydrogenase